MVVLLLYVDDMLVASNDLEKLEEIKGKLDETFETKDLGEPKSFLRITIERNKEDKYMNIHQARYTESVLKKFHMEECKPQSTPMVTRQVSNKNKKSRLEESNNEDVIQKEEIKRVPYREAIESLMYLENATRPDIAFAVNYLAKKQLKPTEEDWQDVKRVFRYLKETVNRGLIFRGRTNELEALTDASFRDCTDSTSTGGYIIKLFEDVIAWRSHKQTYVTLSTCQAEYLAMSEACQEVISLDKSLRHVVGEIFFPSVIWCDNRAAGNCIKKDGSHKLKMFDDELEKVKRNLKEREDTGNRKHMADTHGDFVKQCANQGKVEVRWIETRENLDDIMTKPLPLEAFAYPTEKNHVTKSRHEITSRNHVTKLRNQ
ncbi:uncharacterized protein LOC112455020 [Temnothorax curvispinosus]|uniref:Uncharacterized protein LOC112455020 n=1 Tax=Temnothorax curvispinosus TaxID=300111 RepID=A0A6J1PUC1_9HYME|nr:uncharacterized protein LOC112455020 [Temnothorax curvispinosus]